tara:strand:- start:297 stop:410 length:114 start_codon:yes stop_codon:yes gene_type:complete
MKKSNKKYAELLHQASIANERKEAVGFCIRQQNFKLN